MHCTKNLNKTTMQFTHTYSGVHIYKINIMVHTLTSCLFPTKCRTRYNKATPNGTTSKVNQHTQNKQINHIPEGGATLMGEVSIGEFNWCPPSTPWSLPPGQWDPIGVSLWELQSPTWFKKNQKQKLQNITWQNNANERWQLTEHKPICRMI